MIIGRAQFFTENTLYPVMVSMRKPEFLRVSARLWAIVFATNLAGALLFALLAIFTGAFGDPAQANLVAEGVGDTSGPLTTTFWSAVVTGWLLALVAWLVEASEHAIGQIAVIYAITLRRRPGRLRPLHRDHGRGVLRPVRGPARRSATCSAGSP